MRKDFLYPAIAVLMATAIAVLFVPMGVPFIAIPVGVTVSIALWLCAVWALPER